MKTLDNRKYTAEDGCLIVRKSDDYIMGDGICLGLNDSIDNYTDKEFSAEEIARLKEKWHPKAPEIPYGAVSFNKK